MKRRKLGFQKLASGNRVSKKETRRKKIHHLPTDIILNILSRLPVKTLCRLRCVSTLWRDLISEPHFLSTHHDRAAREPLFLFSTLSEVDEDGSRTIQLSSVDQQGRVLNTFTNKVASFVYSLHTCSDLVCFAGAECIYVCNPSTEEFVTLPQASRCTFYPIFAVGLGYSSSSKAYKVVHLFEYFLGEDIHYCHGFELKIPRLRIGCEVLTLGCSNSSWRRVEDFPYMVSKLFAPPFAEGSLHWLITRGSDDEIILSFNLDIEEFRVIPHPEFCSTFDRHSYLLHLVELRGCLCLLKHIQPSKYDIWMLKDYKNHIWVKEYTVDLSPSHFCENFMNPRAVLNPRAIRSNGAILMEKYNESLDCYDPESGTLTRVDGIEVEKGFQFSYYVESFYSLGSR